MIVFRHDNPVPIWKDKVKWAVFQAFLKAVFQCTSVPDGWKCVFRQLEATKEESNRACQVIYKTINTIKNTQYSFTLLEKHCTKHKIILSKVIQVSHRAGKKLSFSYVFLILS